MMWWHGPNWPCVHEAWPEAEQADHSSVPAWLWTPSRAHMAEHKRNWHHIKTCWMVSQLHKILRRMRQGMRKYCIYFLHQYIVKWNPLYIKLLNTYLNSLNRAKGQICKLAKKLESLENLFASYESRVHGNGAIPITHFWTHIYHSFSLHFKRYKLVKKGEKKLGVIWSSRREKMVLPPSRNFDPFWEIQLFKEMYSDFISKAATLAHRDVGLTEMIQDVSVDFSTWTNTNVREKIRDRRSKFPIS